MHHVFTKFDDINDVGIAQHVFSQHWVAYDAIFAYEGVFVFGTVEGVKGQNLDQ